jgi:hypothetical protein
MAILAVGVVLGVTHLPTSAQAAIIVRHAPLARVAPARPDASVVVTRQLSAEQAARQAAEVAHQAHIAHRAHLHVLHLRQLAVWAARARAHAQRAAQLAAARAMPAAHSSRHSFTAPAASGSHVSGSGIEGCIISRESGGQLNVMNASGHYGLYQFDAGTWASGGGNPADFGHASQAEQHQVFENVYAARGSEPWTPSDGCTAAAIKGAAPTTGITLTALIRPAVTTTSAQAAHLAHLAHLHHLHVLHLAQLAKAAAAASRGATALAWAVANASGHWYSYGAIGPSYYDCSGLVMTAYKHAGISLPHNTVAMLSSSHLVRTSSPAKGDLAFFGTGHVEFYVSGHTTFGAHHTGTTIGYRSWTSGYPPTAFYKVR